MSQTVRIEKRKRGFFGKIVKFSFVVFNIVMLVIFISGIMNVSSMPDPGSEAGRAGAAIGTALGIGMILFIWAVVDIILGIFVMLTRGSKIITESVR